MKNRTSIHSPELEQLLADNVAAIKAKSRLEAETMALRNRPHVVGDSMGFYIEAAHHAFQKLLDEINTKLQIRSHCFSVLQSDDYWTREEQRITNHIRKQRERLLDIDRELRKYVTIGGWLLKALPFLAVLLTFMDGLLNRPFFEAVGLTYVESLFAASGLGLTLWGFSHYVVPWVMDKLETIKDKLIFAGGVLLGASILFYFLGKERARYATTHYAAEGIAMEMSHWPFTLLSLLFFIVACAIALYIHQQNRGAARSDRMKQEELKREERKVKKEIKELQKAFAKLDETRIAEESLAAARIEYGYGLEQQVISSALECFSMYKKENLLHRGDMERPSCFNEDYPFEFTTYCTLPTITKRKRSFISGAVMVIGMAVFCSSCHQTPAVDRSVIFVIDLTDPLPVYPDSAGVMDFLHAEDDLWAGIRVEIGSIGETDIHPVEAITLPKQNRVMNNKKIRERKVAQFKGEVWHTLDHFRDGKDSAMGHSIIYYSLALCLTELVKRPEPVKDLVMYTNCMENSEVNFYDPHTLDLLTENPDSVERQLQEQIPLPLLHGISVYFIYEPTDYQDNSRYRVTSGFFKNMLEENGAVVHIQARL